MTDTFIAPAGLKGVVVADTRIGDVRGDEGRFHYRGLDAIALAESAAFEDVWHLVLCGSLPDPAASAAFRARVGAARAAVPADVLDLVVRTARDAAAAGHADPLEVLRVGLSRLAIGETPLLDASEDERLDRALTLAAQVPTLLAAASRAGRGLEPIAPDPAADHVADYLRMTTGAASAADARALASYLIATVDHGSNASTFAARVVASTGAGVASCVLAAIGAFLGPLHGGAPSRALAAILEIEPGRERDWVRERIARGERIMGFGHAVYRTRDPRSEMLRRIVARIDDPLVPRAIALERAIEAALAAEKPGRDLHANVEYYAGVLMRLIGLDPAMFTATFAVARVVGWSAHVLEQAAAGKIIRPATRYVGPEPATPR